MSDLIKQQGYFSRLWEAITGKGYAKEVNRPKEVNRGAAWAAPAGVKPTYSQGSAMAAFGVHGYTHAAAVRSAQDLAALPLKLLKGSGAETEEIKSSPVLDLLFQPNSETDEFLFREQLCIDLMLAGNCYILLLGPRDNAPLSLARLHPDEVRIVTDPKKGLTGYEHSSSGSVVIYPPERIIHGRNASYAKGAQGLYGTGAVEALSREIDADLNAQKLASDASAKGRPDILLYPKEDGDIWPSETRRQIADQYGGLAKQGGALVLSGQVEVRELQLTPREMEFEASRRMARESISAVLGVPPTVLGLPAANYATSRQQAINYWTNQIKRGRRLGLLFTKIAQRFDPDLRFEHDYSGVEALQTVRSEQLARVERHIFNGIDPRAAYQAEGLDYPTLETPASSIGEEEEDNARAISLLARSWSMLKDFNEEFSDLPVSTDASNPQQQPLEDIRRSVLGAPPNWERFRSAHALHNPEQDQMFDGYLLLIARRYDEQDPINAAPDQGELVVYLDMLSRALDILNGAEGRLPINEEERERAYRVIRRYYDKLGLEAGDLSPVYLDFEAEKKTLKLPTSRKEAMI